MKRIRARDKLYLDDTRGAVVSSKPIEGHSRTTAAPGIQQQIQQAIRHEHIARALAGDMQHRESFEEANDFNVGDDYDPSEDEYSDLDAPPPQDDGGDMERNFARALVGVFESAGIKFPSVDPAAQASPEESEEVPRPPPSKSPAPNSD